jgi:hypothetical protein
MVNISYPFVMLRECKRSPNPTHCLRGTEESYNKNIKENNGLKTIIID